MNNPFTTELVHCCVCNGTGKIKRFIFGHKPCAVCSGSGQRRILMSTAFSPEDAAWVRQSAVMGSPNIRAAFDPPSLAEQVFGFRF